MISGVTDASPEPTDTPAEASPEPQAQAEAQPIVALPENPQEVPLPWTAWIVPALLVAVACTQIAISKNSNLTSWKGGGFGMFATYEHGIGRIIECRAIRASDGKEVTIRLDWSKNSKVLPTYMRRRLKNCPMESDMRWVGARLVARRLITRSSSHSTTYRLPRPTDVDTPKRRLAVMKSVTLRVWQRVYDHKAGWMTTVPLTDPVKVTREEARKLAESMK